MRVKSGLAEMLKGGVIMDVVDAEQAKIAEDAGACAVMALERVPADIRAEGGVARMADPDKIGDLEDPRQMAQWMKKMGREMGEDLGDDFDELAEEAAREEAGGDGEDDGGESEL